MVPDGRTPTHPNLVTSRTQVVDAPPLTDSIGSVPSCKTPPTTDSTKPPSDRTPTPLGPETVSEFPVAASVVPPSLSSPDEELIRPKEEGRTRTKGRPVKTVESDTCPKGPEEAPDVMDARPLRPHCLSFPSPPRISALERVQCVAGVSAGALMAVAVATKVPPDCLRNMMEEILDKGILQWSWVEVLTSVFQNRTGLIPAEKRHRILLDILSRYLGLTETTTLTDFYRRFKIDLVIGCFCQRFARTLYFHRMKHPNYPLLPLLEASISIPLLFPPVEVGPFLLADGGVGETAAEEGIREFFEMQFHKQTPEVWSFEIFSREQLESTDFALDVPLVERTDGVSTPLPEGNFLPRHLHRFQKPSSFSFLRKYILLAHAWNQPPVDIFRMERERNAVGMLVSASSKKPKKRQRSEGRTHPPTHGDGLHKTKNEQRHTRQEETDKDGSSLSDPASLQRKDKRGMWDIQRSLLTSKLMADAEIRRERSTKCFKGMFQLLPIVTEGRMEAMSSNPSELEKRIQSGAWTTELFLSLYRPPGFDDGKLP
eukprot:CAMPEP_0113894162 /NCGR_PEP_ID=MMETSP0780_2-20120614/16537_1 /TAXON_ID=652834 /ORGANISM="Palpitomonas bilix" /LENGTH=541 /DNA_ID=CAMNT_0000884617 /DNA_START=858 /DNA_END=2483 /DNA_ORIENTATION=+ /assembly_acc=CAM_ASM_000599